MFYDANVIVGFSHGFNFSDSVYWAALVQIGFVARTAISAVAKFRTKTRFMFTLKKF